MYQLSQGSSAVVKKTCDYGGKISFQLGRGRLVELRMYVYRMQRWQCMFDRSTKTTYHRWDKTISPHQVYHSPWYFVFPNYQLMHKTPTLPASLFFLFTVLFTPILPFTSWVYHHSCLRWATSRAGSGETGIVVIKMGKAGRIACIFTPYVLTVASLICLILVGLGCTNKNSSSLNNLYFFRVSTLRDPNVSDLFCHSNFGAS